MKLQALAQCLVRVRDVLDDVASFTAALRSDAALRDELTVEIWNEFGEPAMPQLRPLPSSTVSLDVPVWEGGPALVELLEALPVDEAIRRARALEDHGALIDALDEAQSRAGLSPQEARLWHLTRHERCSMREIARRTGWSEGQVHVIRHRTLRKIGAVVTPPAT